MNKPNFTRQSRIHRKKALYIRTELFSWAGVDSNHRSLRRQIYSLLPLATREPTRIKGLLDILQNKNRLHKTVEGATRIRTGE